MDETSFPSWQEIVLSVPVSHQDEALGKLVALGYDSCWIDQPITNVKGPDGWQPVIRDPQNVKIHVYTAPDNQGEVARLAAALGEIVTDVTGAELKTEDWLNEWRLGRKIVELRDGWSICPPWLVDEAPNRERALIIDPGLAFGVGDHTTTHDCSGLVLECCKPGDRVLDLGAGSGVLSLLARKVGAAKVVAVEIDELAAGEIARNAGLNGIEGVETVCADASTTPLAGPFDLMLANIGAAELRRLAPRCTEWAAPGAKLVLSGLVDWAADGVQAQYEGLGWRPLRRIQGGDEWVTLLLDKD